MNRKEESDKTKRSGSLYLDVDVWEKLEEVTKDSIWSASSMVNMMLREKLGLIPKQDKAQRLMMGDGE